MPQYKHVIFDFDGTLVDSAPAILATFALILDEAEILPAVALDQSLIGPPLIPTLRKLSGSDDPLLIDRLAARFKAEYDEHMLPLTVAYPGVSQMLRGLGDNGMQLHIATNKRENPTLRLLDFFAWRSLFSSIYCIDSPPGGFRDKTEMLGRLLAEQKLPREASVFIGDTNSDADAAAGNDVSFLAVAWGYGTWPSSIGPIPSSEMLSRRLEGKPSAEPAPTPATQR